MSRRHHFTCLLAIASLAFGASAVTAQTKPVASDSKTSAAAAAKELAKTGPGGARLQDLVKQLRDNREAMIADHDALAKKLKVATEQEKKAIKEKMERQMKAFEEQQATLHKQIRDEQRRQRVDSPGKR
jgi:hypothetical protein